ncbi:hypothetical protein [Desulfovibrio subterraneus]|uniref:Capsule polysaccharide biosynthesis protein n=1 Tax=Desulfovibrio subterraneus TaxID=2718620 RepID=A0A7J0BN38_9BACT|nr:hypothetical protein [Desulfovibrio subterraneus]GFM35153.1 hypothetical protein DSM101010T_35180 [Desulfovibrio subterraneus]
MKKVLYIKSPCALWSDLAAKLCDEYAWQPSIFLGANPESKYSKAIVEKYPDVQLVTHSSALRGCLWEGMEQQELSAIDAPLVQSYSGVFQRFYEVGRRYFLPNAYHSDYFAYCYRLIRIYTWLVNKRAFDIVIANSVPHRFYDNILYEVCKRNNVPFLGFEVATNFPQLHYVAADFEDRAKAIGDKFKSNDVLPIIPVAMRNAMDRVAGAYQDGKPEHFQRTEKRLQGQGWKAKVRSSLPPFARLGWGMASLLIKGKLFSSGGKLLISPEVRWTEACFASNRACQWQRYLADRGAHLARRWYERHTVEPDLTKPYIYFSASRQPERSTAPDAGRFADLALICECLSSAAPAGWNVYYKEHPSNFRKGDIEYAQRSVEYYERIRRVAPRVQFIASDCDPFELIDRSKCVAAATGSVVWEAALRGKPSLIWGDFWLRYLPGVQYVSSAESCGEALVKIQEGLAPRYEDVERYVAALYATGLPNSLHRVRDIESLKRDDADGYGERLKCMAEVVRQAWLRCSDEMAGGRCFD